MMPFEIKNLYSRKQIRKLIGLSENIGGPWTTGYASHDGAWYLFVNIGVPGRTGHDYNNFWQDGYLHWYAKNRTTIHQAEIKRIISSSRVHIFTRTESDRPFFYEGRGIVKSVEDTTPVKFIWQIDQSTDEIHFADELRESDKYIEGALKRIVVNAFERDQKARRACLDFYGYSCAVCMFNFEDFYGEIGKDFIHVHHLKPLSEIGESYKVDPVADLRPLCPNCHAMIHSKQKVYTIEEIRSLIEHRKLQKADLKSQ